MHFIGRNHPAVMAALDAAIQGYDAALDSRVTPGHDKRGDADCFRTLLRRNDAEWRKADSCGEV
jgi:hypothetical protein